MRLLQKAGVVGVGALSVLGGLALPASPAGADELRHDLTLGGTVRIKDDEVIARRDEYCTRDLAASDSAQLPADRVAVLNDTNNRCGGEVRVEVKLVGTIDNDAGWCVDGWVELYEGASESNGDLDGSTRVTGCATRGGMIEIDGRVNNTDEGGDWVDYRIDILAGN